MPENQGHSDAMVNKHLANERKRLEQERDRLRYVPGTNRLANAQRGRRG